MSDSKYKLKRVKGTPVSDKQLLDDLVSVSGLLKTKKVTLSHYEKHGYYDCSTIIRRFGTWNVALKKVGLEISHKPNKTDEEMFDNILRLWEYYGRQPRRSELSSEPSTISQSPYNRRFGSWTSALEAFVDYANESDIGNLDRPESMDRSSKRKTSRDPNIRLRWKVLQRDHFTCVGCGMTPALNPGVTLHVDHIVPWSKGGETTFSNLQTLCSRCNLGKSDYNEC